MNEGRGDQGSRSMSEGKKLFIGGISAVALMALLYGFAEYMTWMHETY